MSNQAVGTAESFYAAAGQFLQNRQVDQALEAIGFAERCGINPDDCSAVRWDCWMFLGDFERAWAESDLIASRGQPDPHRFWDGQSFAAKRVLLRCLHGLGDTVQFIRYAPLIRERAKALIVETHPQLVRLLRSVPAIDQVITWGDGAPSVPPDWDSQIEVNELPRLFRSTLATIPVTIPYINVPAPAKFTLSRKRVGLIWNSSQWNPARSVPVQMLLSALAGLDLDLVSLQHGPDRDSVQPSRPEEGDVLDTATDMLQMDLVISVDTMTAHLAGALAIPVWVLLPFEADWRWMLSRTDSPWYPTMRLFRQESAGDWGSPLAALRSAAIDMIK